MLTIKEKRALLCKEVRFCKSRYHHSASRYHRMLWFFFCRQVTLGWTSIRVSAIFKRLEIQLETRLFIFQNISRNTNLFKNRGQSFLSYTKYYLPIKNVWYLWSLDDISRTCQKIFTQKGWFLLISNYFRQKAVPSC